MITPPLIVDEHGDISVFETVESAERSLEPIDVKNNEYIVYDRNGYLLNLRVTLTTKKWLFGYLSTPIESVTIEERDDALNEEHRLKKRLVDFIERVNSGSHIDPTASLEEIVELVVGRYGYNE